MAKVGRNEPCPCGSGKKYKKCCEPAQQRSGALPHAAASTGLPDTGPDAKMAAFAEPLLDATDGSHAQLERAFRMATLFWNLAVIPDDERREEQLGEMLEALGLYEQGRQAAADTARAMVERHRSMFPELHRR